MNAALAIDHAAKQAAFQHYFGLSPAQSGLLVLLFNARGEFLTTSELAIQESINCNALLVRIHRLRRAMNEEAIDSDRCNRAHGPRGFVPGPGFRLTDVGLEECRTALNAMTQSLMAADELLRRELLEDFRL